MNIDTAAIPGAVANRMLEREAWARQRISAHAGRAFVIRIGPLASTFAISASGIVDSSAASASAPDLTLRLSPLDVPAFLADPTRWDRYVVAEGDPALAQTLKELAPTLPWFVEQAFAGVLGPVAGQNVADAGRRLLALPEYAAERIGASAASYAREQAGLLARGDEGSAFAAQVSALAARTDELALRMDTLAARLAAPRALRTVGRPRRT
jgi:ubiquinone biosynthesis accessory factor UbiJ